MGEELRLQKEDQEESSCTVVGMDVIEMSTVLGRQSTTIRKGINQTATKWMAWVNGDGFDGFSKTVLNHNHF